MIDLSNINLDLDLSLDLRAGGIFGDLPVGYFDLIVADPPWSFKNWSVLGQKKGADAHYRCMTLDDIKNMPVASLCASDAILWLWVTNPMLPHGLEVMNAWGFEYKTHGSWQKLTKHGKQAFGTGYIFRSSHETYLIGTRGKPKTTKSVRSSFSALAREHSRKPDEAYEMAERLMPDAKRLDLFSRQKRAGWVAFGDEISKFETV